MQTHFYRVHKFSSSHQCHHFTKLLNIISLSKTSFCSTTSPQDGHLSKNLLHGSITSSELDKLSAPSGATSQDIEATAQGNKALNRPGSTIASSPGLDLGPILASEPTPTPKPAPTITYLKAASENLYGY